MIGALFALIAVLIVALIVTAWSGPIGLGLFALAGLVAIGGAAS